MKKLLILLLIIFVGLPILALVGIRLGWSTYIEPKVRSTVIQSAKDQGFQLQLAPLQLNSWWFPLHLQIKDLKIQNASMGVDGNIPMVDLVFAPKTLTTDFGKMDGQVSLTLQNPQFKVVSQESIAVEKADGTSGTQSGGASTPIHPLALQIKMLNGQFQVVQGSNQVSLENSQLEIQWPQIMGQNPMQLQLNGQLVYDLKSLPFPLQGQSPLSIQTHSLQVDPKGNFSLNPLSLNLGGLSATLVGSLQEGQHQWQIKTEVPDLAEMEKGGLLPTGNWKGGLVANLQMQMAPEQEPSLAGKIQLNKISGKLAQPIEKEGVQLAGGMAIQGIVDFQFFKSLQKLNSNLAANLSSLTIHKKDLFYKKAGVPFTFSVQSQLQGDKIQLTKLNVELAQIKSQISGVLATVAGGSSQLAIQLPATSLNGLETMLLPMRQYPVKGQLALTANVAGDLQNPDSLQIVANPIDLQISSGVNFKDEEKGYAMQGPFVAKVKGLLEIVKKDVAKAQLVGNVNLDSMSLKMKNGLAKNPKQKLSLVFAGGKKGNLFEFSQLDLQSFFGEFIVKGSLANPLKPKLNLDAKIKDLDLVTIRNLMKSLQDLPIDGRVQGDFKIQGVFDSSLGVEKSPLKISGKMIHNASLVKWNSPKPKGSPTQETTASPVPIKAEPLLPNWPVVKTAQLDVVSKIDKVIFNDLTVTEFFLQGRYDQGLLTGFMSMNRLFSGKFQLKDINANLYQVPTYIQGTAVTEGLDIKQAVTWGMPEQKDLVKGALTGGFKVKTPFPSHADPLANTQSVGKMKIEGFEVSTLKLDEMINGLMKKIPGMEDKKEVRTKDVKALFSTDYSFKNGTLAYKNTNFITPENHQLVAEGTLHMDKSMKLKGHLYVTGVKVKDRLASCLLDSQGRLEVPVEYVGSIVEPKMSNSTKVIEKIGGKYIECERKSQLKKAEAEVKKEADKIIKQEGKKVEEKLKNQFKKLFK